MPEPQRTRTTRKEVLPMSVSKSSRQELPKSESEPVTLSVTAGTTKEGTTERRTVESAADHLKRAILIQPSARDPLISRNQPTESTRKAQVPETDRCQSTTSAKRRTNAVIQNYQISQFSDSN